jgi:hypothetical protein
MNWNPLNWFRDVARDESRKAFAAGLVVAREEYAAGLMVDGIEAQRRGLDATLEAIGSASKLDTSDPAMAAVIAAFKSGVVNQAKAIRSLMEHPLPSGEERQEALSVPFDDASNSGTSTNGSLRPAPRALTNGKASLPKDPPKRRRGRPSKEEVLLREKAKLKGEGVGRPDSATDTGRPEAAAS